MCNEVVLAALNIDKTRLAKLGGQMTASEIEQQPVVWLRVARQCVLHATALDAFLAPLLAMPDLRIILTGAGTSAFIGECMVPMMLEKTGKRVEAVPTTDLVSGPQRYFQPAVPTLMVSFARSGGSPESSAAVTLADQLLPRVWHLVITCNADGALYRDNHRNPNVYTILLPDETHDRAFAMTTSFSSMLIAASLAFGVMPRDGTTVRAMADAASCVMGRAMPLLSRLAEQGFQRVVYLGSNELKGLAREAALKLLELTDGQVVAMYDSPLGFRHGPKTIVDKSTLVVLMLSNNPQARRYDLDLLDELRREGRAGKVLALNAQRDGQYGQDVFMLLHAEDASDLELVLPMVVFCQVLALLRSLELGVRPDTPSASGTVNRVVSGVTIYPYGGADVSGR